MATQHPKSEAHIAAMFDRVAPRYDLLNRLLSARQDQRWRKRLVREIPFRPDGRYLDVATGTGDVILAAAAARPEYRGFLGVDISGAMLDGAAAKARAVPHGKKLEFKRMSAEKLDVESATIDCLSISFGLRNVVRRDVALAEFARVLAPGGVLLILEFFIPTRGLLAALFQFYFHHVLPFIGGLISDRAAYKYLPESVGSFYAPDALRAKLYDNGLTVEGGKSFLFGACRLVKARKI
jgi:demethylmenaquinone methyltransferase/2-methoxy-6-polyprenyl-1,4-benzoquinol methylase